MIRYCCEHCRTTLQSPAALAGKEDTCPACGRSCVVPVRTSRSFLRGLAIGIVAGALVTGIAAFGAPALSGPRPAQEAGPRENSAEADPPPATTDGGDSTATLSSVAAIEKLTTDDVMAFAERHEMAALGGWRMNKNYKKVWDEDFRTWKRADGLFIRCVWFPGPKRLLKEVFIGKMNVEHGPEGMASVLEAWHELCPDMVSRFQRLFDDMRRARMLGAPLRWVGESPYAIGVSPNNKAFVKFIGPQSAIPKLRRAAAAAANVRISWWRCLVASAKRLDAKLSKPLNGEQVVAELAKAMSDAEHHFGDRMVLFACGSAGYSVDYIARQQVEAEPLSPLLIPDDLPAAAKIRLQRTAAEITAIARLSRFMVERGDTPRFKPYEYMLLALAMNPGVESSAWGDYGDVEGTSSASEQLPLEQRKRIEEIAIRGMSHVLRLR